MLLPIRMPGEDALDPAPGWGCAVVQGGADTTTE